MPRKILVPVDLVDERPEWLEFPIEQARAFDAEMILVHVVDYVPTVFPVELPTGYKMPQIDDVRAAVQRRLQALASSIDDVRVKLVVEVGGAARAIVDLARREDVDHIIIASHQHGPLARMVLGSVAERVARTAPCPVTIVRER